jgi:hypothetical protein
MSSVTLYIRDKSTSKHIVTYTYNTCDITKLAYKCIDSTGAFVECAKGLQRIVMLPHSDKYITKVILVKLQARLKERRHIENLLRELEIDMQQVVDQSSDLQRLIDIETVRNNRFKEQKDDASDKYRKNMKVSEYTGNQMGLTLYGGVYQRDINNMLEKIANDEDEYSKYSKYEALHDQYIQTKNYLRSLEGVYLYGTHHEIGYVLDEEKDSSA